VRIIRSAISIARMLEAQTLLIVSDGSSTGRPAATVAWRDGRLANAPLKHLAHDDIADVGILDSGPFEGRADDDSTQLRSLVAAQSAAEPAERRARGGDDDGSSHGLSVASSPRVPVAVTAPC
jgi:hypothetical protein